MSDKNFNKQSGIFLVDKPLKMSSNQLVQKIKHQFNFEKVGHAGTLDPLASGLMIILVNKATKLSDFLLNDTKSYFVKVKLYQATSTGDSEGEIIESVVHSNLNQEDIEKVLKKYNQYFYDQLPPIYSAIKIDGKKLYEYARKHQQVEIKPRSVEIKQTNFIDYDQTNDEFSFTTIVSKGTYIRSLVIDICKDLNTIGYTEQLRRLSSSDFKIEDAKKIEQLTLTDLISPTEVINKLNLKTYSLNNEQYLKVNYGQNISLEIDETTIFLVYENKLVALYEKISDQNYKCVKNNLE